MVYCSKEEFAIRKGYASWAAYALKNPFPTEAGMDDMLEDMTALMNAEIETTTDITDTNYTTKLRNICYRGVELMIDEEEGRSRGDNTMGYVPKDYMYERDRKWLEWLGVIKDYRVVGGVSS